MYSKVYFPIKITDKYTYSSASHNHAGCPGHGVRFGKHLVSLEEFSKSPLTISSSIPVPRFSFKTTFFSSTPLLGVNWIEQVVLISTRPGFAIWSYCFKIKWLVMGSALPSVKLRLQDSIFSPLKFSHLVPCTFPPFYRDVHSPPSPCARTASLQHTALATVIQRIHEYTITILTHHPWLLLEVMTPQLTCHIFHLNYGTKFQSIKFKSNHTWFCRVLKLTFRNRTVKQNPIQH